MIYFINLIRIESDNITGKHQAWLEGLPIGYIMSLLTVAPTQASSAYWLLP